MKVLRNHASAAVAAILVYTAGAHSAPSPPSFEVAYRAWDIVTELARHHGDPKISGACGKTFRPFVIPGLRRQIRPEEDAAAAACVEAARSACANAKLRNTADITKKCEEFR
jgi:hypothetical protein